MKNQSLINTIKNLLSKPQIGALTLSLALMVAVLVPGKAEAVTPSFSAYSTSNGIVQMNVQGDPNAAINLYYYQLGSNLLSNPINVGTTNSSGYFSTSVSQGTYGIPGGATAYVVVNGQQSPNAVWPNTFSTGSNVYISQPSVTVSVAQTSTVNIYGGTGSYTIQSNSNPSIASITINGNILQVYGVTQGVTTVNICASGSTSNCASFQVTVTGTYYGSGSVTLSQSSVYLNQGQSQVVTINGGGSYYITNNPNTNIATASINGNQLVIYGVNPGSVSYSICSGSGTYSCAAVYVNVSTYYNPYSYNNTYPYNYYTYNNTYPYNYGFSNSTYNTYPYSYTYPTTYTTYTQPTTYYTQPTYSYSSAQTGTPVSGVFLNQVPATGISFGLKVTLFTLGLLLWSAFGAYIVYRKYPEVLVKTTVSSDKALQFKLSQMKKKGF
ncbi:MAG: hypothetical protein FGM57_01980 [Candidatus Taylorbacteria bacterium]|nr:hypothetical protein [Candidatus Taylorbacteria bacterium]